MSPKTEGTSQEYEPEAFQSTEPPASAALHDSGEEKPHLDELHFKQDGVQADATLTGVPSTTTMLCQLITGILI
jgi:hypothetical protein